MNFNLISNTKENNYLPNWKKHFIHILWILVAALFSFISFRLFVVAIDINFRLISNFITGIAMIFGIIFGNNSPDLEAFILFSIILVLNIPILIFLFICKFDKKIIFFTFLFLFAQWFFNIINIAFSQYIPIDEHAVFPILIGDDKVRAFLNAFIAGILIGISKIFLYNGRAAFGSLDALIIYFSIKKRKDIHSYVFLLDVIIILAGIIIIQGIRPIYNEFGGTINYPETVTNGFIRLLGTLTYVYATKIIADYYSPKNKIICCNILIDDLSILLHFLQTIQVQRTFTYWPIIKKDLDKTYENTLYNCYLVLTDYEIKLLKKYIHFNCKNKDIFINTYMAISVIGYFENITFQSK